MNCLVYRHSARAPLPSCGPALPCPALPPPPPQADGTLVVPPFDNALSGITLQRMMELLPGVSRAHGSC